MAQGDVSTLRPSYAIEESVSALVRSVFIWMTGGLAVSGFFSWLVLNTASLRSTLLTPGVMITLFVVELGLVFWLSARVHKMSATKASAVFLLYSALNGIVLSPIFLQYTSQSITSVFTIAAGMFAAMAVYGYTTKRDLSGMGSFMMMGLIGILLCIVVNIFLKSSALYFAISAAGVLIFTGLTAWDMQKIRRMGTEMQASPGETAFRRVSIIGALTLYLDFINLFIMLLRLFGDRR